jgi:hypothetical protein
MPTTSITPRTVSSTLASSGGKPVGSSALIALDVAASAAR